MIKLKSLLPEQAYLTEKYAVEVKEDIMSFLKKNCRVALEHYNNGSILYRGDKSLGNYHGDSHAVIVDPKGAGTQRLSKDTSNAYVMYMDTSYQWERFPSRSWSLICGSKDTARSFAGSSSKNLYCVFPVGDPLIAVSTDTDFIEAEFSKDDYRCNIAGFDNILKYITNSLSFDDSDKFILDLRNGIKRIQTSDDAIPRSLDYNQTRNTAQLVWQQIRSCRTVEDAETMIYDMFTPKSSNTKLLHLSAINGFGGECWLDGQCVLINIEVIDSLFDDYYGNRDDDDTIDHQNDIDIEAGGKGGI